MITEPDQVGVLDELRTARPGHALALRVLGIPDADMPERVDDALARENSIGRHELVERLRRCAHGVSTIP